MACAPSTRRVSFASPPPTDLHWERPLNVYHDRALAGFSELVKSRSGNWTGAKENRRQRPSVRTLADPEALAKAFKECTSASVIVFLAVHGGADSQGAFLLPRDADPKDPGFAYRLDKVLAALAKLPEKTKKLLVLDATRVPADWSLHMVHNDFALRPGAGAAPQEACATLSSSAPAARISSRGSPKSTAAVRSPIMSSRD